MKPKIVVIGSANMDMIVRTAHIPKPGETVLGNDFLQSLGGKGANQAVAAARLGADVTLVARLGQDSFGEAAVAAFKAEGIETGYIVRDVQTSTGVALIMVNQAAENIIAVAPGANACLSPADCCTAEGSIQKADCLLVQLEIPLEAAQAAIQIALKNRVPVILNPAPARLLPGDLLERIDYLTPNETEAALLMGEPTDRQVLEKAKSYKDNLKIKNLIITLGERGAAIVGDPNEIISSFPVKPVDTTGAGDAFNGALAVGVARGDSLEKAVRYANAAGALATTRQGAQASLPTAAEVEAFIKLTVEL
jgi:ribokinase